MKNKELKSYNKYKHDNFPNREFIYIGKDKNYNSYCFLIEMELFISFDRIRKVGFNPEKIIHDLNLETFIDKYGDKYIKGYNWFSCSEKELIKFKPFLKDKLNNIINR